MIFYAHLSYGQASQIARGKKTENLQNGQNQGFLNTAPALIRQTRLFRYFRASLDPRRKTELLICRTSRPAPRKTPHPLKEGIGYKLTAGDEDRKVLSSISSFFSSKLELSFHQVGSGRSLRRQHLNLEIEKSNWWE